MGLVFPYVLRNAQLLRRLLEVRHPGLEEIGIIVPFELLAKARKDALTWNLVLGAIAGISLLVGGIGIMNIMLASVLERKSEIGLLRAIGAKQADVVRQFLVETSVIAAIGALLGVVLGIVLAYVIAAFAGCAVAWSIIVILVAVVTCIAIAVGFGVYPAMSAARLDPVAALQSD